MARAWTWLRMTFRQQRWELALATLLCLGLAAAALWLAADMRSLLTGCGTASAAPACEFVYPFQESHGEAVNMTRMAIEFSAFGLPLALGVPIVTREIEQRTALIAWPLAGSRLRWLAWRAVPVFLIGMALMAVLSFAAEQLSSAYQPKYDLGFLDHGSRGISMVTRGVAVLVASVAVGAVVGRLLPALLVGMALSVGLSVGLDVALPSWVESTELRPEESIEYGANSLTTDFRYRGPDGEWMTDVEAELLMTEMYEAADGNEPDPALLPQNVFYGVAVSRYPEVLARESAVIVGATVLAGALAAAVVRRRRPE